MKERKKVLLKYKIVLSYKKYFFVKEVKYMRVVIKVGTSTLAYENTGLLHIRRMKQLCEVLSDIKNAGHEVILVSSGAIGMGMGKLGLDSKPHDLPGKQACAAIGQCELMYTYDSLFSQYNHIVGQILITKADVENDDRKTNFINTMEHLLKRNVLPIVNENDTIATEEIVIGDNDNLGAILAKNIHADLYIILSDIDGLYDDDPHKNENAKLIPVVYELDEKILSFGQGVNSNVGTGGMKTKLEAAKICMDAGLDMIITNGQKPEALYSILDNESIGTRFVAKKGA